MLPDAVMATAAAAADSLAFLLEGVDDFEYSHALFFVGDRSSLVTDGNDNDGGEAVFLVPPSSSLVQVTAGCSCNVSEAATAIALCATADWLIVMVADASILGCLLCWRVVVETSWCSNNDFKGSGQCCCCCCCERRAFFVGLLLISHQK